VILAIETSCDDTCAAVLDDQRRVLSNIVSSQTAHAEFGGVVPEIAARHHLELIDAVISTALKSAGVGLDQISSVAVTQGPGLSGALLVGVSAAKGIAAARGLPLRAVNHLHGHVAASYLANPDLPHPFLCLVASGGHTLIALVESEGPNWTQLGATLDDAAGEAFDKGARLLGLDYPGGPALERLARSGDSAAFDFPTARGVDGLDFSFAGLKTSLLYKTRELGEKETLERASDLAASYQAAIARQLSERIVRAVDETGCTQLAIGGGVAANGTVREAIAEIGLPVSIPAMEYCTDNAAMIGRAALSLNDLSPEQALSLEIFPTGRTVPQ